MSMGSCFETSHVFFFFWTQVCVEFNVFWYPTSCIVVKIYRQFGWSTLPPSTDLIFCSEYETSTICRDVRSFVPDCRALRHRRPLRPCYRLKNWTPPQDSVVFLNVSVARYSKQGTQRSKHCPPLFFSWGQKPVPLSKRREESIKVHPRTNLEGSERV